MHNDQSTFICSYHPSMFVNVMIKICECLKYGNTILVMLCQLHPKFFIIKPQRMREGYGSRFVCKCVSVTALAATYLVYVSKVRRYTVSCRLLKICRICVDFAEKHFLWEIWLSIC